MSPGHDTTSGFGRGAIQLAAANACYVLTAYVTTTGTARILEPREFAVFGVVMAWITVLTALLVKGLSTSIGREMAAGTVDPATAWHAGRVLGMRAAAAIAAIGAASSWFVADLVDIEADAPLLALGAVGALTFGANAVLLAWPIGTRSYARQAVAQAAYAVARVALVLGGAGLAGLDGAVVGYVLAPLAASAPLLVRHPVAAAPIDEVRRRMRRAAVPVALVSIAITAYFVVDVFALSAAVGGSSRELGSYVAYGTIAHVPFFLLQATSVAMVPAIAAASGAARASAVARTMTDTVVLLAGPTAILVAAGDAAARVVFGDEYDVDRVLVAPLALATAGVTVLAGLVAVDVAIGRLRTAVAVVGVGVGALAATVYLGAADAHGLPRGEAASSAAWASAAVSLVTMFVLGVLAHVRRSRIVEPRRAAAGLALGIAVSLPPLLVDDDAGRLVVAVAASLAWLAAVVLLPLVDVRRAPATQVEVAP